MEEQVQEKNTEYISYLFNTKSYYYIQSQTNGGRTFYKTPIKKKNYDGQEIKSYIQVKFGKCEPVPNGTKIRIKNAKEDWYINPKDTWNIIPQLVIFDYEIIERSDVIAEQAIQQYNSIDDDTELPY